MPMYSDRRATPVCCPERLPQAGSRRAAKRGPPIGLSQEGPRTASTRWHGQPARAARRSLPENFLRQSCCANVVEYGSRFGS
jgi:hypothetical protein